MQRTWFRYGSIFVARPWGIPIRVHFSLFFLVGYIFYTIWTENAGWKQAAFALALAAAMFVGVALHELGHSLVALRKGCRVREITLLFIGGVAQMDRLPARPRDELVMALAGPAVSVALGTVLFFPGLRLMGRGSPFWGELIAIAGGINYGWAVFNLLPAFPMDGGRVLRALLTRRLGRLRATALAARLGKVLAIAMGLVGGWGIPALGLRRNPMLIAIAVFVFVAARREYRATLRETWLRAAGVIWGEDGTEMPSAWVGPPPFRRGPSQPVTVRRATWPAKEDEGLESEEWE